MTSTGSQPAAQAGNGDSCEQPTCCHCNEPCSEDNVCNPDDLVADRVYVCDTCSDKFYQEWQAAEEAELIAWQNRNQPLTPGNGNP